MPIKPMGLGGVAFSNVEAATQHKKEIDGKKLRKVCEDFEALFISLDLRSSFPDGKTEICPS